MVSEGGVADATAIQPKTVENVPRSALVPLSFARRLQPNRLLVFFAEVGERLAGNVLEVPVVRWLPPQ